MHHHLLVHIVWTTRDRAPILDLSRARLLAENLPVIVRQERGRVLAVVIVATHVHLIIRLHPTTSLPRLLQRLKGGAAHRINTDSDCPRPALRWAKGYSVTSVSPDNIGRALIYVRSQHRRHPDQAISGWPPRRPESSPSLETDSETRSL